MSDESEAEKTSEYDSNIYTDSEDIEFLSSSEEEESYFTTKKRKASASECDDNTIKRSKKEDSAKSLIEVIQNSEIKDEKPEK